MDGEPTREDIWNRWPGASSCRVPTGLSDERLRRWYELRTIRDGRLAGFRGRPFALRAWRRRLERRRASLAIHR